MNMIVGLSDYHILELRLRREKSPSYREYLHRPLHTLLSFRKQENAKEAPVGRRYASSFLYPEA